MSNASHVYEKPNPGGIAGYLGPIANLDLFANRCKSAAESDLQY